MSEKVTFNTDTGAVSEGEALPVGLVPTPTLEYARHNVRAREATERAAGLPNPRPVPIPIPIPWPLFVGPRVLIWKQDPTVTEIGVRKVFLPGLVRSSPLSGLHDARIGIQGMPIVWPNAFGDYIETPGTDAFDAVHTFAVVRQSLTMVQRVLGAAPVPWQWNSATNTDPIGVFPHAGVTMNAFYSRSQQALKFFFFTKPGDPPGSPQIFTCRSLDIVSHETGHAILDGMQPGWIGSSSAAQTGALHESFGDLMAIFLTLSQLDQVEAVIAQTKANLHDKTFLSDLAEQFGLALGRPNGLRNADNNLRLSQVSTEVHDLSQVFTGAIYDVLADLFHFERNTSLRDDAATLHDVAHYLFGLLLRAIRAAPASNALFADVANQMMTLATADGKPVQYRGAIRNNFTVREVVVAPLNFTGALDEADGAELVASEHPSTDPAAGQNRRGCCGTMLLPEFNGGDDVYKDELEELRGAFKKAARTERAKAAQVRPAEVRQRPARRTERKG